MDDRELMRLALKVMVETPLHPATSSLDYKAYSEVMVALEERLARREMPVAYMQGTALYWPEDAEVDAPDCIPLYTGS